MENNERLILQKIYEMEKGEGVMFTDLLKELNMPRLEVQPILNKLEDRKLFGRYKSSDESITILPAGMKALGY